MSSIRMFLMCDAMNWNHLPVAGGLYDQHPQLLADFSYIFNERAKRDERRRKLDEARMKRKR